MENGIKIEVCVHGKKYSISHKISHAMSVKISILKGLILRGGIDGLGKIMKDIDEDQMISIIQKMEKIDD